MQTAMAFYQSTCKCTQCQASVAVFKLRGIEAPKYIFTGIKAPYCPICGVKDALEQMHEQPAVQLNMLAEEVN